MKKSIIIDVVVYTVIGALIWLVSFMNLAPYAAETTQDAMKYYSDCFIIPGILLLCLYLLSIFGKKGMYDGLTYSFRFIGRNLVPFLVKPRDDESYYAYKQLKAEKRKEPKIAGLFVGLAFILIAIIFYILYKCC